MSASSIEPFFFCVLILEMNAAGREDSKQGHEALEHTASKRNACVGVPTRWQGDWRPFPANVTIYNSDATETKKFVVGS